MYSATGHLALAIMFLPILSQVSLGGGSPKKTNLKIKKVFERTTKEKADNLVFSADTKTLAVFTLAKFNDFAKRSPATVQVWDLKRGRIRNTITPKAGATGFSMSGNGKLVAINGLKGIEIWNAETGRGLRRLVLSGQPKTASAMATDVQFGATGKWVTATYSDNPRVWNVRTGRFSALKPKPAPPGKVGFGTVHFAPKGDCLYIKMHAFGGALGTTSSGVAAWNTKTAKPIGTFFLEDLGYVGGLGVSADGATIIGLGRKSQSLLVWDMTKALRLKKPATRTVKLAKTIPLVKNRSRIGSIAISPDGKLAAIGVFQISLIGKTPIPKNQLRIVDVASGQALEQIDIAKGYVGAIRFSPDGKFLAATSGSSFGIGLNRKSSGKLTIWSIGATKPKLKPKGGK